MNEREKRTGRRSADVRRESAKEMRPVLRVLIRNMILAVSLLVIGVFLMQQLLSVFTRHNKYKNVPDFTGIELSEAHRLAEKHDLRIEVNDSLYVPAFAGGVVLEQKPASGAEVKSGRRIFVTVNSYHQKMVTVPYVTGFSLRQAKNNLESVGLEISELRFTEDIAANYVLGQRIDGREVTEGSTIQAELGSGVVLTIGMNESNAAVVMPDLTGLGIHDAKSRIWENGLNVGRLDMDSDIDLSNQNETRVYGQSPQAGETVTLGERVMLNMTLDGEKVTRTAQRVKELMEERRKAQEAAALLESVEAAEGVSEAE